MSTTTILVIGAAVVGGAYFIGRSQPSSVFGVGGFNVALIAAVVGLAILL